MSVILGVAGARRNGALALCDAGRIVAFCEQERLTRTRGSGLRRGRFPLETLETVLRLGSRTREDISTCALTEDAVVLPPELRVERLDHHYGHASTSFHTSPFDDALILICDRHSAPDLSVWRGDQGGIRREPLSWNGPGFAAAYAEATEVLGFGADADEHRLEALAQVGRRCAALPQMISFCGDRVEVSPRLRPTVGALLDSNGSEGVLKRASIAESIQRQVGEALLEFIRNLHATFGGRHLCLGGGLFYNSYFNTLIEQSGFFERTFIPVNPGNAGVAVGAALAVAGGRAPLVRQPAMSPFLGPAYETDEIKGTLDNCKLSYDYFGDGQLIDRTAAALAKGKLVGWFQGRMEWGPRALGNRSILASPVSPYVLENLNLFLKRRAPHRPYSVSMCADDTARFFRGPASSQFMEFEYEPLDRATVQHLLPLDATRLRLQTVPESMTLFHRLIKAFGALTGVPILVNTSFNGFNEPIVCSPRDAVRVFYGTGLDMAVIGNFVLQK
jgi:carbamoyltransferase